MRVTNQMSMNRMLLNINRNARRVDFMYQQLSSGKRIQVPSDNPIIASRALKFRTNISETEQYMRNARQAESWMRITEEGFKNMLSLMENMRERLVQGASDGLTIADRDKIVVEMKTLAEQIAGEMNVTHAGRHVFSGFRTDMPPFAIRDDLDANFDIIQRFGPSDILRTMTFVKDGLIDIPSIHEIFKIDLPYRGEAVTQNSTIPNYLQNRIGHLFEIINENNEIIAGIRAELDAAMGLPDDEAALARIEELGQMLSDAVLEADRAAIGVVNFTQIFIDWIGEENFDEELLDNFNTAAADFINRQAELVNGVLSNIAGIANAGDAAAAAAALDLALAHTEGPDGLLNLTQNLVDAAAALDAPNGEEFSFVESSRVTLNSTFLYAYNRGVVSQYPIITMAGDDPRRYTPHPNAIHFIPETGELVFGANVASSILETGRDGIRIEYNVQRLYAGEPNPILYFETWDRNQPRPGQDPPFRHFTMENQHLTYEFGVNTRVRVNNLAKDVFRATMFAELINFTDVVGSANVSSEAALRTHFLAYYRAANADREIPLTEEQIMEAVNAAVEEQVIEERRRFADFMHNAFTAMLGRFDEHHASVLREDTILGSRLLRVEITTERLEQNVLSFTALMSDNEDIDFLEVIMNMTAMEAVYQASMMAGARIQQMTLADFIR